MCVEEEEWFCAVEEERALAAVYLCLGVVRRASYLLLLRGRRVDWGTELSLQLPFRMSNEY